VRAALRLARDALDFSPTAPPYLETFALAQRAAAGVIRRTEPCPCESGQRYKDCCGRVQDAVAAPPRNEAVARAYDVAASALALGDAARAYDLLAAAEPEAPDPAFKLLLKDCCERLWQDARQQGLWSKAHELLGRLRLRAADAGMGGTLVISDVRTPCAESLEATQPARVVIHADADADAEPLIDRLVELEESGMPLRVDLVAPGPAGALRDLQAVGEVH
jgi:hypothetical protein